MTSLLSGWEFPTDQSQDELAGITTAHFDPGTDAAAKPEEPWVAAARFNQACAGYRIRVHPKEEASYIIYGGTCEFGPEVVSNDTKRVSPAELLLNALEGPESLKA